METFNKLFGSLLTLVYHCFDRLVILAYMPLLTRPEQVVYFFRDVNGLWPITQQALRQRTDQYRRWVEFFAQEHQIPIQWADKGVRKEDQVRPYRRRLERQNRFGVYFIYRSMEIGPTSRCLVPRYPTKDPDYRFIRRHRSRYTHYYFYLRDPDLGPISLCVGTFLPFQINCWLNGHGFMQRQLERRGIAFRKDDNAFLRVDDPALLQQIADGLTPGLIQRRLNYWIARLGPQFSLDERRCTFRRFSLQQVEYCRNFPIHKLFERSCDLGLLRLTADQIFQVFGWRLHRRLRGKLHSTLSRFHHGHHVFRACCKKAVLRMYEKFNTFLRLEVLSNDLTDFRLRKSLEHLPAVRQTLAAVTDRFADFQAQALQVHVDFPLFQRLALPIPSGQTRIPGIKIHDTRMIRLMQALLHAAPHLAGWTSAQIHRATLQSFGLTAENYSITQLRYDLRKMKAHGLIERLGRQYRYRLTDKGTRVCLLFVLFHQRVCGPLAHSLFHPHRPSAAKPATKLEAAYRQADRSLQRILDLLAA